MIAQVVMICVTVWVHVSPANLAANYGWRLKRDRLRATAFRSDIGHEALMILKDNLARILGSTTTEAQYDKALASFTRNPEPPGSLLRWVCREDEYLNLAEDRLELTPA